MKMDYIRAGGIVENWIKDSGIRGVSFAKGFDLVLRISVYLMRVSMST